MVRARSSAGPLAAAWAALIVYASLYPFAGWSFQAGQPLLDLFHLPWPVWRDRFDEVANVLGYAPFGALLFLAWRRPGRTGFAAVLAAVAAAAGLSYGMEVMQGFLPVRVPSAKDLVFNMGGAGAGAMMAMVLHRAGAVARWQTWRDRWFVSEGTGALVLLMLWPVGLLFPPPVPLALGQVWNEVRDLILAAVAGTPWSEAVSAAVGHPPGPGFSTASAALTPLREGAITALGLLAPCLVAYAAARPGWRRLVLALGAGALGFCVTSLSTALNFGPQHAFAWPTAATAPAFGAGLAVAAATAWLPPRAAAGAGLMVLTALVLLVAEAPVDPYHAASLQGWEQGRFIRFHGVAQWVGWLWPYLTLGWLLGRVSRGRAAAGKGRLPTIRE